MFFWRSTESAGGIDMSSDLLHMVDAISREKNIDKENIFIDIETGIASAMRRAYGEAQEIVVKIHRGSGKIEATLDGRPVSMVELGRIAAQTFKQVMIQKLREDERSSLFEEYSKRVGTLITGVASRMEGGTLVVNLGRGEAIIPRSEQLPGETHHPGDRVRAMILDVRESASQIRIVLSRTHPDFIKRLFEAEVPEVAERIIEIRALAREPGYRTKVAVSSIDMKVDAVGACVGVRGSRIKNIVEEINNEKIDIVRWNESSQILITNALKPAEIKEVFLCFELGHAVVVVADDQLSLAIGKRGQNVRLASRLTGWDIDILTPVEYDRSLDLMESTLRAVAGVDDVLLDKILAIGIISVGDLALVGAEPLVQELEVPQDLAERIVAASEEAAKRAAVTEAARLASQDGAGATETVEAAAGTGELGGSLAREGIGDDRSDLSAVGGPGEADRGDGPEGTTIDVTPSASGVVEEDSEGRNVRIE
ncbi:MAG: transcription termination factor NusA [Planctomycetota bacterium]|nr:MAG: transcription termination factor NusA [Planctomycetota bacterium]MCQ3919920.1 transcription termination factor NusA [Planctomycetota bacterium]